MSLPPSPPFRTPFTDVIGCLISHQWFGRCADLEMKAIDCLEAYGLYRGVNKCKDIIDDYKECALRGKQENRIIAMRMERQRQYWMGERSKEDRYAEPPKVDSF